MLLDSPRSRLHHRAMRCLLALVLLIFGTTAQAEEVDVELFLAVDVSRSMTPAELEIQRRGYAEALNSAAVFDAITDGLLGKIALTYVEWAGSTNQRVVVDWTLIETREELSAFAQKVSYHFDPALRRTSISGALMNAAASIETNRFEGLRRVVDVSGDGPNNQGLPVLTAREAVLDLGIIINGLPLMTLDGLGSRWTFDNLDTYYRACVIGGPGAFVIPVLDWEEFAAAVRKKLVLEIAGLPNHIVPAQATPRIEGYDCLIGEKIWEQNRRFFELP